jgi:hypothetical protein
MHDGSSPADAEAPPSDPASRRARPRRKLASLLRILLGLSLGLAATEVAFRHRDRGAYPLVNVYEADDRAGVRLAPGSVTRVASPEGEPTSIRINQHGYRGSDWPPPSPNDMLVVGDSLSFGLGVEEGEALGARLRAHLGGSPAVLDASVPTYGPPEYLVTMERELAARRPSKVILVLNLINDLAELDAPNLARHAALDGYAARVEPDGPPRSSSRLRTRVIQRSHAAFAFWRWARTREIERSGLGPEPGVRELLPLAFRVEAEDRAAGDRRREEAQREAARASAQLDRDSADQNLLRLVRHHRGLVAGTGIWAREWDAYIASSGAPRDVVFRGYFGGCAPPPREYRRSSSTQAVRITGSRVQRDVETLLWDMAKGLAPAPRRTIAEAFEWRERARRKLASLRAEPLPPLPAPSPLPTATFFAQASALAAAHGASLVVVVAPLDAQGSIEARTRRGLRDREASALDALTARLAREASVHGALGIDGAPALREAGEGAFLRDGHLSAKGHDALARAVAREIQR